MCAGSISSDIDCSVSLNSTDFGKSRDVTSTSQRVISHWGIYFDRKLSPRSQTTGLPIPQTQLLCYSQMQCRRKERGGRPSQELLLARPVCLVSLMSKRLFCTMKHAGWEHERTQKSGGTKRMPQPDSAKVEEEGQTRCMKEQEEPPIGTPGPPIKRAPPPQVTQAYQIKKSVILKVKSVQGSLWLPFLFVLFFKFWVLNVHGYVQGCQTLHHLWKRLGRSSLPLSQPAPISSLNQYSFAANSLPLSSCK